MTNSQSKPQWRVTDNDPRVKAVRFLHEEIVGFDSVKTMYSGTLYQLAVDKFTAESENLGLRERIAELEKALTHIATGPFISEMDCMRFADEALSNPSVRAAPDKETK